MLHSKFMGSFKNVPSPFGDIPTLETTTRALIGIEPPQKSSKKGGSIMGSYEILCFLEEGYDLSPGMPFIYKAVFLKTKPNSFAYLIGLYIFK